MEAGPIAGSAYAEAIMFKALGWGALIIFLIGLAVVMGVIKLIL